MLKAILFDLDGTLTNTDPFHYQTWANVLATYQITIDSSFYKTHISGKTNAEIVKDIFPHFSAKEGLKLANLKESKFRELAVNLEPLEGLNDFLYWVKKQSFKTGLVTNAPRENTDFMLKMLNLSDYFDQVILSDEIGIGKPDPAPYQYCLNQLNILAEEAIAFEDSPSGIRSAIAAGIETIGVASTHEPKILTDLGVALVIEDFNNSALGAYLQKIE
ncbi:HAD family hydrolase [Planktothrix pseudagardhii]|uniref:Haloacid dehalogenase-like hydrolase domain-containing protein Sgpp n=1 Tax=Planktothrix pseudagardhii TaxID=132604 RepID=A0A9W4G9T0_9CYAN|nr:HAD family phosphatase [Planktothrix pseudagardhii]CAD5983347.1 Haloacid dehalogenase-like hydrolase domain-containing protein Sgpp [Planktothrix pseudagardhii]